MVDGGVGTVVALSHEWNPLGVPLSFGYWIGLLQCSTTVEAGAVPAGNEVEPLETWGMVWTEAIPSWTTETAGTGRDVPGVGENVVSTLASEGTSPGESSCMTPTFPVGISWTITWEPLVFWLWSALTGWSCWALESRWDSREDREWSEPCKPRSASEDTSLSVSSSDPSESMDSETR